MALQTSIELDGQLKVACVFVCVLIRLFNQQHAAATLVVMNQLFVSDAILGM